VAAAIPAAEAATRVVEVAILAEVAAIRVAVAGAGAARAKPSVDGKKIMEQIATRTGGRFFEAKRRITLEEIYGQIVEELRGQYLLTYTPDKMDRRRGFHKIALKANKDDLTVATREGYFAPGGEGSK